MKRLIELSNEEARAHFLKESSYFNSDMPRYISFEPILNGVEDAGGKPLEIPKGAITLIKVTPTKMVYHHNRKGIKNALWSAA